eukprot:gnl/TRDRNA2_/TRDRNA2_161746_c1_seq2.p4 gnl/TRDRNA2_/TRDRNA2_161746_c1~~gnl/TRDRNA2_/TRDRNA2_161746_c1_seq2.p4  ORF type:complete len:136 (+),score=58.00 gnl/TRDRNA2_/TRDRNA2_161746_c1_seq2:216-623(+)
MKKPSPKVNKRGGGLRASAEEVAPETSTAVAVEEEDAEDSDAPADAAEEAEEQEMHEMNVAIEKFFGDMTLSDEVAAAATAEGVGVPKDAAQGSAGTGDGGSTRSGSGNRASQRRQKRREAAADAAAAAGAKPDE